VERSSNDDSPIYTVRYGVRASILLPLAEKFSIRKIHVHRNNKVLKSAARLFISPYEELLQSGVKRLL
jgi:hypothetical protein